MKWSAPAKTFLLGEYAAVAGESALIFTSEPCFELCLSEKGSSNPFHEKAPAGQLLLMKNHRRQLQWHDPYQGLGGLGGSSAEFLCAFRATHKEFNLEELLESYFQFAWSGKGIKPSGYDLIAQSLGGCVYINRNRQHIERLSWPFSDLSLLLIHTGNKLPTHQHLENSQLPEIEKLSMLADQGKQAFDTGDTALFVDTVQASYQELLRQNLVASHTQDMIQKLQKNPNILAVKGCGAMGSDVILVLVDARYRENVKTCFADFRFV